jgi:hypothetical protein
VGVCMGVCRSAMLRESLVVHRRACADSDGVVQTATAAGGTMEAVDRSPSGGGWPRRWRPPLLRCCESRANLLHTWSRCTLTWRSQKEPPAAAPPAHEVPSTARHHPTYPVHLQSPRYCCAVPQKHTTTQPALTLAITPICAVPQNRRPVRARQDDVWRRARRAQWAQRRVLWRVAVLHVRAGLRCLLTN